MKKFIKGKWFPFVFLIVLETILFIVLYHKDFRITYSPNLETSWDATSAFAAWAGVIMSFLATMIAIWIPKKIADRQDKITLFERRIECYHTLQVIFAFARQISDVNNRRGIYAAFKLYFGECDSFSENQNFSWYVIALKRQEPILVEGAFLFSEYNEKKLQCLLMEIIRLSSLTAVKNEEEMEQPIPEAAQKCKEKICNICSDLERNLIPLIENHLRL